MFPITRPECFRLRNTTSSAPGTTTTFHTLPDSLPKNSEVKLQPIEEEVLELPRESRVTLAQLHSGYCSTSTYPELTPICQSKVLHAMSPCITVTTALLVI